jgi:hypothetical protein
VILNLPQTGCSMELANQLLFIIINWVEILGIAVAFWLIRNIKNELNVKLEVQTILIFWTFFSVVYFSLNISK